MDEVLAVMSYLWRSYSAPQLVEPKRNTTFPKNKFDWRGLVTREPRDGAVILQHVFSQRL